MEADAGDGGGYRRAVFFFHPLVILRFPLGFLIDFVFDWSV